ncbi:MAG: gamma-glutamyltransferase, partial [Proteobacteria bacterium]
EEQATLRKFPSSAELFLKNGKTPFQLGEKIIQKDLAQTLREIAQTKDQSFYEGALAKKIVSESSRLGKWLSRDDFKNYKVRWMEPVQGKFGEYQLFSMPPPSSGGTHVIQILNLFEKLGGREFEAFSVPYLHRLSSSMQVAFRDRARFMGDPDFVSVPTQQLLSESYLNELKEMWNPRKAWTAIELENRFSAFEESNDTTHFSMMDAEGNVVVSTQTINGWFGSGWVVPGTGILMNNEMDDFSAKTGASNLFGAIGGQPNSVAPHKTPLSSMSPTIVMKGDLPILAVGAPGGTKIITCVAQTILHYLNDQYPLYESIALPRIHHQWRPDAMTIESQDLMDRAGAGLKGLGYSATTGKVACNVMAVSREGSKLHGVSDPRDFGMSLGE